MTTNLDTSLSRPQSLRSRHQTDFDLEDNRFGRCDCTSYSYFILSLLLLSVGTLITILALGDSDGFILGNLGHMWLIGPIFICSGMMVAVKSMLYLRRKCIIQMYLHQRAIIQDIAADHAEQLFGGQLPRNASTVTLPPAYDVLITVLNKQPHSSSSTEPPPPSYEEAMCLIDDKNKFKTNKSYEDCAKPETSNVVM